METNHSHIKYLVFGALLCICFTLPFHDAKIGDEIDRFNEVPVYFNGTISNVHGRNISKRGYNLGLKWQCVEFVKRYYLEYFNHYMPDSYGHAKDFFDQSLSDRAYNIKRGLLQFRNTRGYRPKVNDILIYGPSPENQFGHMGIISEVCEDEIEIVQQNFGLNSRQRIQLVEFNGIYTVADFNVLGWLRMPY